MELDNEIQELQIIQAEIIPIRTETVLSQYPLHKLSKGADLLSITISKTNSRGKATTTWEVSPNPKYGEPGILAYKVDTLVINRIIDQLRPNIPPIIKLGSLSEIGKQLGREGTTRKTADIAHALSQNAGAMVICKIEYAGNDGRNRTLELRSTRYGVVFTGERLPNGRKADAVYITLNPGFHEVLKHAKTRPLDYEYIRALPPSAQRLYELISFQIFAALRYDNPRAKYLYSDLCKYAPLTRYEEREEVRKQLYKIHQPHIKSGYIKKTELEETTVENGLIDWIIWYTPGRKAKAEYRVFTKKRESIEKREVKQIPAEPEETSSLTARLISAGITESIARELAREFPEEGERQLDALPYRERIKDKGAYLVKAIRDGYALPEGMAAAQRKAAAQQAAAEKQKEREEREARELQQQLTESLYAEFFAEAYFEYVFAAVEKLKTSHAAEWSQFEKETSAERKKTFRFCDDVKSRSWRQVYLRYVRSHFDENHPAGILDFEQWDRELNEERFDPHSQQGRRKLQRFG